MKNKLILLSLFLVLMALLVNCPGKVDITKDFAMVLNDIEYKVNLNSEMTRQEPAKPQKLEIYNFAFDTTFENSLF